MKIRHSLTVYAVAVIASTSSPLKAATWDLNYMAGGVSTSAIMVTSDKLDTGITFNGATVQAAQNGGVFSGAATATPLFGYDILSITGSRNGQAITGLVGKAGILQSSVPGYIFDNVLFGSSSTTATLPPSFDILGLEYQAGNSFYNVYYSSNGPSGAPQ
jgi:hypothetical protein